MRGVNTIDLRYGDDVISVAAPAADDLTWLAEALACGFATVDAPPAAPAASVRLTVDAAAHDALLARGRRAAGEVVEGFAQDADRYVLEPWQDEAGDACLRDPRLPAFYRIDRRRRRVELLARAAGRGWRMAPLRVVRELAMDRIVAGGGVLVHGAAVASAAGVIAISAPKQHGKTTLLLSLLEHTGVAYVSNDRCVLRAGADGATLRGLPTIVSITRDGLARFPALRERIFAARPALAAGEANVGLAPQEFTALLTSPRAASGPAAAFLFPSVTTNPQRLTLRRLDAAEALQRFRAGLFRSAQDTLLGEVFRWDSPPGLTPWQAGEAAGRWLVAHRACFAVELGGDGAPTAAECRDLLESVSAAGPVPGVIPSP